MVAALEPGCWCAELLNGLKGLFFSFCLEITLAFAGAKSKGFTLLNRVCFNLSYLSHFRKLSCMD